MRPEEAARRRDFTVNAIAWDPLRRPLHRSVRRASRPPRAALLRMVDPATFGDDSLRVLRGVQLAARFDLEMDGPTRTLCRRPSARRSARRADLGRNREAAPPRAGSRRSAGASPTISASSRRLFPELKALDGCPQEPEWHPEGDVWVHTLMVVDQARTRIDDLPHAKQVTVMLGAVCHDLGKPLDDRVRRRPDPVDGSRAGGRCAGARVARSTLNIHTIGGFDVRRRSRGSSPITSSRCRSSRLSRQPGTARSAGWRRKWTSSCWRGSPSRTASGAAAIVRLQRDRLVSRAGARAGRRACAAAAVS